MPHISIDGSGFVVTRPDAFMPNVDIVRGDSEYTIIIDVPGMVKDDISIYRQNVVTLVEGTRGKSSFDNCAADRNYEKQERKFGDFSLNFKIPEEYERKWYFFECDNGILCIKYHKDNWDETEKTQKKESK
jgi:HSP20 family molecular chaperone IbpA